MSATTTTKETVMGQVIPRQHPAVVLKSHYKACLLYTSDAADEL